jgi:hypothetical protein
MYVNAMSLRSEEGRGSGKKEGRGEGRGGEEGSGRGGKRGGSRGRNCFSRICKVDVGNQHDAQRGRKGAIRERRRSEKKEKERRHTSE